MDGGLASDFAGAMAARWWVPVVRGLAAILFGVLALAVPGITLFALVILWGAYAVVDGIFAFVVAARQGRAGRRWGWWAFEGFVSVLAGVAAFAWPGITALVLLVMIAVWAIVTGLVKVATAVQLRKEIDNEWLLGLSGVLSIAFGVVALMNPAAGALAVVWMIGGFAILFGAMLVGLGVRLNQWRHAHEPGIPTGGTFA